MNLTTYRWTTPFLLLMALLIGIPTSALAQETAERTKHWIFLSDKGPHATDATAAPVTERARLRRALRGAAAPASWDLPPARRYLSALEALGVEPLVESRWLNAVSAWLSPAEMVEILALPFVTGTQPVGRLVPEAEAPLRPLTEAPVFPQQRRATRLNFGPSEVQLALVNAVAPLERGLDGTGVRLGVIDTGLGPITGLPAFEQMLQEGRFLESRDFTGHPDDGNRHARSVLSIAAGFHEGNLIGPAHGADVLHARTEYVPTETNQEEDNFVAAIEWMEAEGVDVINVSLGYFTFDGGERSYTYEDMDGNTAVTSIAADRAVAQGVAVVVAAGNWACDAPQNCWYYIASPADADSVITVGGTRPDSLRYSSSSYGPTSDGQTKPDVVAMAVGVHQVTTGGGYGGGNGTSFAAPMVAGVVAQMLQANPSLTPMEIRDILHATSNQAAQPDNSFGWGIVDADAATRQATLLSTTAEVPTSPILEAPYPNPFQQTATFLLHTPLAPTRATLQVYDALGRLVATPFDGTLPAGLHPIPFHAFNLPPGVYLYHLVTPTYTRSGSLVHLP